MRARTCVCVCEDPRARACGVCPWAAFFKSQPETLNSEIKQDSRGSHPGGAGPGQQGRGQGGAAFPASSYGQGAADFYSASGEWAADGRAGRGRERAAAGGDWRGALGWWGVSARCVLLAVESLQTCCTRAHTHIHTIWARHRWRSPLLRVRCCIRSWARPFQHVARSQDLIYVVAESKAPLPPGE